MLPQVQELVPTTLIAFHTPVGALLTLVLLVVVASGVAFESGALGVIRCWLVGETHRPSRRIATAHQRS
jgi:hypothetical protein